VGKYNSHYYSHRCSTYQENIPVLQFFCRGKLKYKAIVYSCLPPHEDVAAIKEQVQEKEAKHTATSRTVLVHVELDDEMTDDEN